MSLDIEDFNARWLRAWSDKDVPALLTFYHPDVAYMDPQTVTGLKGHEALADYLTGLFAATPPMRYDPHEIWATHERLLRALVLHDQPAGRRRKLSARDSTWWCSRATRSRSTRSMCIRSTPSPRHDVRIACGRIPIVGPGAITPEWMTRALRAGGIDARVGAIAGRKIGTGQVGESVRFDPALRLRAGQTRPTTVVGKFPSPDPDSRAVGVDLGNYNREVRFYLDLADGAGVTTPQMPVRRCG